MSDLEFTCPYCGRPTTVTDPNQFDSWTVITLKAPVQGNVGLAIHAITCPNTKCNKLFLKVILTNAKRDQSTNWEIKATKIFQEWQLLPESEAMVLPPYIPKAIQDDYYESCRIKELSPKASATLARRCLQGMIHDFWNIKKTRLKDEIDALEEKVDPLVWEGIDAVRSVGNIGAHMEKDIDVIIDVDPDEAQLLIGLIERLIKDWYIDKHNKREHLEQLKKMADAKKKIEEVK
jgi:hypothetical protein